MGLMKFLVVLFALTFIGVCCVDEEGGRQNETEIREGKGFRPESWRAVQNERMDMSGWVPQEPSSLKQPNGKPVLKRRRLRKRKRRPSLPSENPNSAQDRLYAPNRRQRPFKFGENDEVWDDIEQESAKQAVNRRRVVPPFETDGSFEDETETVTQNMNNLGAVIRFEETTRSTERIRDPFEALKEAEEKQKTPEEIKQTVAPANLKSLLKKTEGTISLSEILQQKNLSLSELLTGNMGAISALTSPPESIEATETLEFSEQTKYRRIPPSERKKLYDRVSELTESDEMQSEEILEAQRRRLALLQAHKENKLHLGVSHNYEVVTEPVTERRIFVPSHPKHYSTASYKPLLFQNLYKTTTVKSQVTENDLKEKEVSSNTIKPFKYPYKRLPVTSAKLQTKKTPLPFNIPPKAIPITIDEILQKEKQPVEDNKDEPVQVSLNFDIQTKDDEEPKESGDDEDSTEKLEILGAGEEIMEIMRNPIYKDKLSRILSERNMTLQELVEQRERGSSQLHLADIFHNKTREPEPIDEPHVGMIVKNDYPEHLREQKSMKFEETPTISNGSAEIEFIQKESVEENFLPTSTENKPLPIEVLANNNSFNYAAIMPFWKQFHPNLFNLYKEETSNSIERTEEIDDRLSDSINHQLNVDLNLKNYHLDEESIFDIPLGIKSALLASFAIVGLSLFMFLTILLIFKWTQRRKNKLNYTSSLSGMKIKSPILELPRKSALRTFVCETLGRRTKFYKSNLHCMSDLWDDKKQKY